MVVNFQGDVSECESRADGRGRRRTSTFAPPLHVASTAKTNISSTPSPSTCSANKDVVNLGRVKEFFHVVGLRRARRGIWMEASLRSTWRGRRDALLATVWRHPSHREREKRTPCLCNGYDRRHLSGTDWLGEESAAREESGHTSTLNGAGEGVTN